MTVMTPDFSPLSLAPKSPRLILALIGALALAQPALAGDAKEAPKEPQATEKSVVPPAPVPAIPPAAKDQGDTQSTGWSAEVAPSGGVIELDDKQKTIVSKVSEYFGTLGDLKGQFVQTTADGNKMKGKFLVKRPGRFRFDYNLPSKQVIISDGTNLAIQDLDLNNEDRVALDQTPFRLLLRKDVDLIRDANITEVQEADDLIVLAIRDKSPDAPGKIKLFFQTKPTLELKEWVTTDAQGLDTKVEISQLTKGEEIDAKLFKIEAVSLNKFHP